MGRSFVRGVRYCRVVLERRSLGGGIVAMVSRPMEDAGFRVAFTERTGGVSVGRYAGLNLGLGSGDRLDRVVENRRRACAALDIPPFAYGRQVHGAAIARIGAERSGRGFDDPSRAIPGTDALMTSTAGVALAVLAADCVPVAVADEPSGLLAVVHAGWRGIAAGIVGRALAAFPDPGRVLAAIGPAVGPDHYEVGEGVVEAVSAVVRTGPVVERSDSSTRPRLNLGATIERFLRDAGVRSIERADDCTACEAERFFSYRRDGDTGRHALIAVRLG